jgi:hypothetical protein
VFERQREIFPLCAGFLPAAQLEMTSTINKLLFKLFCPVENLQSSSRTRKAPLFPFSFDAGKADVRYFWEI